MTTDLRTIAESNQPHICTEQSVAALWKEVLQTAELPDATANFFELGGNSMTMVMLEFRIKEEFSAELPIGALLRAPTVRELSILIDATRAGPSTVPQSSEAITT